MLHLRPDLLVRGEGHEPALILDTKWKRLRPDKEKPNNNVGAGDLYQLYAYAKRYGCPNNVLLYPRVPGVTPKSLTLDADADKQVRIEMVDLGRDLWKEKEALIAELSRVVGAA